MIIRDEQHADIAAIHKLVTAAFAQELEANLVDRLRADGDSVVSLVAVERGKVVGHVQFSKMAAPFRALGLAPVSVEPKLQKSGIGGRLIYEGLRRAAEDGWDAVFVLGDNAYYERFGFHADLAQGFTSPYAGPHLMAIALNGGLSITEGKVDYAPAFAALG